ncbi:MAG: ArgE/DapE family deacylase [Albidovulum sp.]|nr:ArgE/DapE family deacylase [Albidovulum sp.]
MQNSGDAKPSCDPLSEDFLTRALADLVRTPSTNPGAYESEVAHRVMDWLAGTPVEAQFVESMPGRYSVGAILRGKSDGPRLVLNGHMDTVPVDDEDLWKTDPFGAEIRNGFLYGRGACDMKAGLAVQIGVAHRLAKHVDHLAGALVLHFAIGEERAEPGTLSLLKAGYTGDLGIVTEPTELGIAAATRGLAPIHIRLKGRSIHASRSHLGINPAWALQWVLEALQVYKDDIQKRSHELLSFGSCTPTSIRGGVVPNAVSDFIDLYVDRRLIPGETVASELSDLTGRLNAARPADSEVEIEVEAAYNQFEPAEISTEAPVVGLLLESTERVLGKPAPIYGAPYASDVRNLVNDAGIEAVNFGPGNVTECHCADERVEVRQLVDCARVVSDVAERLLLVNH